MGLVYIGKIVSIQPIEKADRLELAIVVCGKGGKWSGCIQKGQFKEGDLCQVYLQDSILPQTPEFAFMEKMHYRVRMMRLRGVPSECLIMPQAIDGIVGDDITTQAGVIKYEKSIPLSMGGDILSSFPAFIPKTDEPNFQAVPEMVAALRGYSFYATVKADGTSATAYCTGNHFGVCSRNWEMKETEHNILWAIAKKYKMHTHLPSGYALQWETVGPKIQGNPMGLKEADGLLFNLWDIDKQCYCLKNSLETYAAMLKMPTVEPAGSGIFDMDDEQLRKFAEGLYPNGRQREGVVIRSNLARFEGQQISFKVINLLYKES